MGQDDWDHMRGPTRGLSFVDRLRTSLGGWRGVLTTAAAVIGLASAAVWLFRDARGLMGDSGPDKGSLRVNINTASPEQLETIPGIGPTRATQIIAGRPYSSVDELEKIAGIGPSQVENMRPFVTTVEETSDLPDR